MDANEFVPVTIIHCNELVLDWPDRSSVLMDCMLAVYRGRPA